MHNVNVNVYTITNSMSIECSSSRGAKQEGVVGGSLGGRNPP